MVVIALSCNKTTGDYIYSTYEEVKRMKKFSLKRGIAVAMMALCLIGGATGAVASAKSMSVAGGTVQYDYTWNGGQYAKFYYTNGKLFAYHWVSIENTSYGGYSKKSTKFAGWTPQASISANTWGGYRFYITAGH